MNRFVKILLLLSFMLPLTGRAQIPAYVPPTAFVAQTPNGTWALMRTDALGNWFVGTGAGSPAIAAGPSGYVGATAPVAIGPDGLFHYLQVDASGNLLSTGSGSGGGTVGGGTTGQVGIYPSNGTAIAGHTVIGADVISWLGYTPQNLTQKDIANGYAGLDSGGLLKTAQAPTWNQNTSGSAATLTTARNLAGNSFNGSANVNFNNKFIAQGTSDAGLTGAQFLGSLGTGIVKNTTATGILSIAIAADFPTLNQNTSGTAAGLAAQYIDWNAASGGASIANKPTFGTVTHTGGSLTSGACIIGNGTADVKIDTGCTTDGVGNETLVSVTLTPDGVHAGKIGIYGNTTLPSLTANQFHIIGPSAATFTAWGIQFASAEPGTGGVMHGGITGGTHVVPITFSKVIPTDTDSSSLSGYILAGNPPTATAAVGVKCYPFQGSGGIGCDTPWTDIGVITLTPGAGTGPVGSPTTIVSAPGANVCVDMDVFLSETDIGSGCVDGTGNMGLIWTFKDTLSGITVSGTPFFTPIQAGNNGISSNILQYHTALSRTTMATGHMFLDVASGTALTVQGNVTTGSACATTQPTWKAKIIVQNQTPC